VKQSDLGGYEENAREKQKIQIYKIKHKLPSNQVIKMANTKFELKRAATKTQGFSMAKDHTPRETKANQTKRQTQPKTPTPRKKTK
jgi:hypothetical protein